jgi:hypothetical protein
VNAWTETITRKRLFGYTLIFAAASWILDIATTLIIFSIAGPQAELNPVARPLFLSNLAAGVLFWLVLLPAGFVGVGYSIWRAEDPHDSALRINAAMVGVLVLALVHLIGGGYNLLQLLIYGAL